MRHSIRLFGPWLIAPCILAGTANVQADVHVRVKDNTFHVAPGMLAYTEFELSGEPLAESLGLDLDVLSPSAIDKPYPFDYAAGIESYEYSEEAMYALDYQSHLGPHLANGPRNAHRGGTLADLGKRFIDLSQAVGFSPDEIPLNMYPISLPLSAGIPQFGQPVDTRIVNHGEVTVEEANGQKKTLTTDIPAYYRDFKTLAWDPKGMTMSLEPAAIGGMLLKEVMWSQDFLGTMHSRKDDQEVEATSATMDQGDQYALGDSAVDGFNGVVLTELSLDKMTLMQNRLAFNGKTLGAKISPDYDPAKGPIWFPHSTRVELVQKHGLNALGKLTVDDRSSTLRDEWMLLWPLAEYYGFSDQRAANTHKKAAFQAVFDGSPFAAAPKVNIDRNPHNDIAGEDAFSLASNLSHLVFRNLQALHFNKAAGTLVDRWNGKPGNHITIYDAAYALVALDIYQRAQNAEPVGYASAAVASTVLKTPEGEAAKAMIRRQADFLLKQALGANGLAHDGLTLDPQGKATAASPADKKQSLGTQFALLRGLGAAFAATGDSRYRQAGRQLYLTIEKRMFDPSIGTWADKPGQPTLHTAWTEAAISGGLRTAMQQLRNEGPESSPELELAQLAQRYVSWFRTVINGPRLGEGMQQAEWLEDTGENMISGEGGDTDHDHVPQITAAGGPHGTAMVMAGSAEVSEK
ncbi:AGE family epimerase/isomerase [Mangrovitalea sediminis]|uniref:hypothetical protein n=1 Tax=Mangrovitalea sediminis TaxID=1982043 RepID=UPI000BE57712|nr:hypothetical protein [Mangrovitalea sediminis]